VKTTVPVIVKDPEVTKYVDIATTEDYPFEEDFFLDGPVSARVAVVDFDPVSGLLSPGVRFEAPKAGAKAGRYALADPQSLGSQDTTAVSVFGTVFKTIHMFEEDDVLGRKITWAFDGGQLLVVPRAGEWANAFYQRESRSLQFFFFGSGRDGKPVLTSHSQDIVSHETAHAILDGIAPSLYDAVSPQSLALHEAIADLTAVISAFRCRPLRERVLQEERGSIQTSSAFSGLGEEFQSALGNGKQTYLRDLLNNKSLDPNDPEGAVDRSEPHELSEVLTGALYTVMVQLHESLKTDFAKGQLPSQELVEYEETSQAPEASAPSPLAGNSAPSVDDLRDAKIRVAGKALFVAAERFKRTILRALDYLPPGEVSFRDYGRAIIASDKASHPLSGQQRKWICDEFVRRSIVERAEDLEVDDQFDSGDVSDVKALDLGALVESDWLAYDFANRHRSLLCIPGALPFKVLPRLAVKKAYYHRDGKKTTGEVIFKVSWTEIEDNHLGADFPEKRRVAAGTTLAIDAETKSIRARLTSDRSKGQRTDRDLLLRKLVDDEMLMIGDEVTGPDGVLLSGVVRGEVSEGLLRVRGSARLLHLTEVI